MEIGECLIEPICHSVSDLCGGVTRNQCEGVYMHDQPNYWQEKGRLGRETFAHFFEATARNDHRKMNLLKQTFPMAFEEFEKIMEAL